MKKGFTLIELLVVISIIGVLAAIVVGSINRGRAKAEDVRLLSKSQQLQKSIEIFMLDNGRVPSAGSTPGYLGYTTAANCQGINPLYLNNWNEFIADMGDQLPQYFHEIEGAWPYCFFYLDGPYPPKCTENITADYVVISAAYDSTFNSIDQYIDGQGNLRYCLYPL